MSLFETAAQFAERYADMHLMVDFQIKAARLDGVLLRLPRKEFDLLAYLVQHSGALVVRDALLSAVWGYGPQIRTRTLDVHIRRLRQNLEPYGKLYVETIFGVGYRFQPCRAARVESAAGSAAIALGAHPGSGAWRWSLTQ